MQTTTLDLGPQTAEVARIAAGVRDDQLGDPTPCTELTVAAVLDHLVGLAAAWRQTGAWEGMTTIAGLQLPGSAVGLIGLNEVLVHGWDVAVATGQTYRAD